MEKVLVTGATGYIGLHCVHQLLNQGYAVNGTLRSPSRKQEIIDALQNANTSTENLNLFVLDLTSDEGWDESMKGCDYVLHVASPLSIDKTDEDFFIKPAVGGVNRAMHYAKKHQVKKVVLTSSVAAVFDSLDEKKYYDENDWSDPDNPDITPYNKSKTLAEKAAWEFVKKNNNPFALTVINPFLVIGPSLTDDLGESNIAIKLLVTGKVPFIIPLQFGFVDVRDVASAHLLALKNPNSDGERFILSESDLWYRDVAKILRSGNYKKIPKIELPVFFVKLLAPFNKMLGRIVKAIGRVRSVDKTTKAIDILQWKPRPIKESILETAKQIKDLGLIK